MTLRCMTCGATGIREEANFCDNCGAELDIRLDDSIPILGVNADISDTGSISNITSASNQAKDTAPQEPETTDEGGTAMLAADDPSSANEGGTTMLSSPEEQQAAGEGSTTLISSPPAEGGTSLLPKEEAADGATSFLSPDEGGTTMLSSPEEPHATHEGGTTLISSPPEEGGTSILPKEEAADGATSFLSPDEGGTTMLSSPEERQATSEGSTSLLPKEEEADGATSYLHSDDNESALLSSLVDNLGAEAGGTQVVPLPSLKDESTSPSTSITASQPAADATRIAHGSEREEVGTAQNRAGGDSTSDNAAAADGSTRFVRQSDTSEESRPESTSPGSTTSDSIKDSDFSNKHVLRIHDRYQLSEILGKGGFGAVYLAEDTKLKRRCVVKQMLVGTRSRRELEIHRANFEREANLLAELNDPGHPNIPEIYDFFSLDSGNYLVMKYIEGQNLKELISNREAKNLSWEEAVRYGADVCSALHYMHSKGIEPVMHRDIKPANVQLGDDGRVWLVDFGLAKADPVEDSGDQLVTQASGSFGYTALEQWFGQAIPASDIYAFGATLHHLVTGLDPLEAYDGQFHIQKIQELHGQFPPIRTIDPDLPEKLEQIIKVAVSPDPEQRPTALQLQQQLEALISGAQAVPLYTFKNGESANTVAELVDLCENNRREAEEYLYGGDFERWFSLINRNDLAVAASAAVRQGKNQRDGLERFLKLILPNILQRRMRRFGVHLARGAIQFVLIALFVTLLLGVGGSYVVGLIMRQSIDSVAWNFYTLDLEEPNRYNEAFLTNALNRVAGAYLDKIDVQISAPDQMNITGQWNDFPIQLSTRIRMGQENPRVYLNEVNNIPLFVIADNISQGINNGIDDALGKSPIDIERLIVKDNEIVVEVDRTTNPSRPEYGTPTPAPTPTPTPRPTPTPVNDTLVVIFNDSNEDITLEIPSLNESWNIAANDTQVIQTPPGTYDYQVKYQDTDIVAAAGTREWVLNTAYRLRINFDQ